MTGALAATSGRPARRRAPAPRPRPAGSRAAHNGGGGDPAAGTHVTVPDPTRGAAGPPEEVKAMSLVPLHHPAAGGRLPRPDGTDHRRAATPAGRTP